MPKEHGHIKQWKVNVLPTFIILKFKKVDYTKREENDTRIY